MSITLKRQSLSLLCYLGLSFALICLPAVSKGRQNPPASPIAGKITRVLNGDTLQFNASGTTMRLQLYGIDAPESGQPMAKEARLKLEALAMYQQVTVQIKAKDMYKRSIALISLSDGRDLSQEMLKGGFAWWYRRYTSKDKKLEACEKEARQAKRGIWAHPNPVPPWEFREMSQGRH